MKKISILLGAVLVLCSCGKGTAKLETQADSLNYAMGYVTGAQIEQQALSQEDDEDAAQKALLEAIQKGYKEAKEADPDDTGKQAYLLGKRVGESLNQMEAMGLMGNKDWEANKELIAQGLVNAIMEHKGGMTAEEAQQYLQQAMMQAQTQQAQQAAPQAQPQQPVQ